MSLAEFIESTAEELIPDDFYDDLDELIGATGQKYFEEALYTIENGVELIDFDAWISVSDLLGRKLTYTQYLWLDKHANAVLLEYEERDVPKMNQILSTYTKETENYFALRENFSPLWKEEYLWSDNTCLGFAMIFPSKALRDSVSRLIRHNVSVSDYQTHLMDTASGPVILFRWDKELWLT